MLIPNKILSLHVLNTVELCSLCNLNLGMGSFILTKASIDLFLTVVVFHHFKSFHVRGTGNIL